VFGPTISEDHPDRLLARGVVRGNVQELTSGARLAATELVKEKLAGAPREKCVDDFCVDDVRERIALLEEPADVFPRGLGRLLRSQEFLGCTYVPWKFPTKT
jgi:hypothetical protein